MPRAAILLSITLIALLAFTGSAAAQGAPKPDPYEGAGDQFLNVLPPGQNGTATGPQVAAFLASGGERGRPPYNDTQLQMYEDLVYASPTLERGQLGRYFKDASFGVPEGQVLQRYQPCGTVTDPCKPQVQDHPCDEVTVLRDRQHFVPHIYGGTRDGAMCAAGYVAAEDRLFLIDVLRHTGRADLSEFAGGSEGNRELDQEQWSIAPYKEEDLRRQITQFDDLYGRQGERLGRDLTAYVQGLNQYVFEARLDRVRKMPGEYFALLGQDNLTAGPENFKKTDIVAIASLVGGIFGKGGGSELESSLLYQAARSEFGAAAGEKVWQDLRSAEDPEAPTTVFETPFPYQRRPESPARGSLALPDSGTLQPTPVVESSTAESNGSSPGGLLSGLTDLSGAGSNALLVSARESASGHPLAVFGPQTGYFSPQLLMEMDIHGPGIDARGAAFAGTNLYVQLGRGADYSWSATSAGQDNVDTFALDLCDRQGPSLRDYEGYIYRGRCRPFEVLRNRNVFTPNPLDPSTGQEVLRVNRTKLGLETARAFLRGDPVVYVELRSTYFHEVDSARGFADFNNPKKIQDARDYQRAAHKIGYTFNWFYNDSEDIAYFNSGENPVRARGVDPNFPVRACPGSDSDCEYEWRDYKPITGGGRLTGNRADYTPFDAHPQVINQRYLTSWNNKQAPAFRANDANFEYQSLYRSIPLDEGIQKRIRGDRKITLVELIDAMESAGTVDLRGDQVLPWMLEVLRSAVPAAAGEGGEEPTADEPTTDVHTESGAAEPDSTTAARTATDEEAAAGEGDETEGRSDTTAAESRESGDAAAAAAGPDSEASCASRGVETIEAAIKRLAAWHAAGAHRRDLDEDGRYEHSCAIEIMDAWWPLAVEGIFRTALGDEVYEARLDLGGIDNEPNNGGAHLGSAYQGGFYGYVEKDLRTVLGEPVQGRYSRIYCGAKAATERKGTLARCRSLLELTLDQALATPRESLYDDDEVCSSSDDDEVEESAQYCYDSVYHTPAGAITQPLIHWINRPTFQQAVEITQTVPRDDDGGGGDDGAGGGGGTPGGGGGGTASGDDEGAAEAAADAVTAGATTGAGSGGDLPFTGLGLAALLLLGALLLAGGAALRRSA